MGNLCNQHLDDVVVEGQQQSALPRHPDQTPSVPVVSNSTSADSVGDDVQMEDHSLLADLEPGLAPFCPEPQQQQTTEWQDLASVPMMAETPPWSPCEGRLQSGHSVQEKLTVEQWCFFVQWLFLKSMTYVTAKMPPSRWRSPLTYPMPSATMRIVHCLLRLNKNRSINSCCASDFADV